MSRRVASQVMVPRRGERITGKRSEEEDGKEEEENTYRTNAGPRHVGKPTCS